MKKHIIYNNDVSRILDIAKEYLMDDLGIEDPTTEEIELEANEMLTNHYFDEMRNLNIEVENKIIGIVDYGRWNGRFNAYLEVGYNINECLKGFGNDYIEVYCDAYNLKSSLVDHDGTSYIIFREFKENVNEELFKEKIISGNYTSSDISRYTRSLKPYLKKLHEF